MSVETEVKVGNPLPGTCVPGAEHARMLAVVFMRPGGVWSGSWGTGTEAHLFIQQAFYHSVASWGSRFPIRDLRASPLLGS